LKTDDYGSLYPAPAENPRPNGTRGKRGLPNAAKALIALGLLLAAGAVQHFYFNGRAPAVANARGMADTGVSVGYDFDSGAAFYSFDSGNFFLCTKDGMKYYTSGGVQKWDSVFSLTSPVMAAQGEVAAVGEANGHAIYVYGSAGKLYEQHFDGPLLSFSVNRSGYLAAILGEGDGYLIEVFGPGIKTWQYHFSDANIYPMSADVSSDGRIVAVAFADANFRLTARIVFAYINNAEGSAFTDNIFSEQRIDGEMPASVRFMEGNRLLVFTDARIRCYQPMPDSTVTQAWDLELGNKIDCAAFYGDKSFAYASGDALLNRSDADAVGTVNFVSLDGVKTGSYCVGKSVLTLSMGFGAAIAGTGLEFSAIDGRGNLLWTYASPQNARQMIFLGNTGTALLASDVSANVVAGN